MRPKSAMASASPSGRVGTWRSLSTRYSVVCPVLAGCCPLSPVGHFCRWGWNCLVHPGARCAVRSVLSGPCAFIPGHLPSARDADSLRGCLGVWWPWILLSHRCCLLYLSGCHRGCFPSQLYRASALFETIRHEVQLSTDYKLSLFDLQTSSYQALQRVLVSLGKRYHQLNSGLMQS